MSPYSATIFARWLLAAAIFFVLPSSTFAQVRSWRPKWRPKRRAQWRKSLQFSGAAAAWTGSLL